MKKILWSSLVASFLLLMPQAALAGWSATGGINWTGTWHTTYGIPNGTGPASFNLTQSGTSVSGAYGNHGTIGTLNGTVSWVGSTLRFQGYWRNLRNTSGGACQYGRFYFDLRASGLDSNNCTNTAFSGFWTYCENDPFTSSQRWFWDGTEVR